MVGRQKVEHQGEDRSEFLLRDDSPEKSLESVRCPESAYDEPDDFIYCQQETAALNLAGTCARLLAACEGYSLITAGLHA